MLRSFIERGRACRRTNVHHWNDRLQTYCGAREGFQWVGIAMTSVSLQSACSGCTARAKLFHRSYRQGCTAWASGLTAQRRNSPIKKAWRVKNPPDEFGRSTFRGQRADSIGLQGFDVPSSIEFHLDIVLWRI